ncbi:MAG: hypothetical protein ABIR06_03350 [Cyclobacteriaceae bacterium]
MSTLITYFEIAAFGASLVAWPYIQKSKHLRLFPLLLFIIVSVEICLTFFKEQFVFYNSIIYNVQVPLQHLLYLYILYLALERKTFRKFILLSSAIFIFITVITSIFFTDGNRINTIAYCTGSIFIIIGILMKFHEMLQNPTEFNFLKNPFFYILFAFLLFNVGTLPYFTMGNWLYYSLERKDILIVLINVMSIFNYILYSTYSMAFVWMILKKESF